MPKRPPEKRHAPLEAYNGKRDFEATPEPRGGRGSGNGSIFVVQEHHARSHHFDLRLEIGGVLVSWAVPKGMPEDGKAKRLAVHVEDHPLGYAEFAGEIPKGSYGAGTVEIWDSGTWRPLDESWQTSFKRGKLKFALSGGRLQGHYVLARMAEEPNWLLRKIGAGGASGGEAAFVSPQLARPVPTVPRGADWLHELKYDGYRLIAVRKRGEVCLFTRNRHDWTDRFKGLAEALAGLEGGDFVMDGEAVVFDEKGRSSFGGLQEALKDGDPDEICFVAFDLLHDAGQSLEGLPLRQRIKRLEARLPEDDLVIRRSKIWNGDEGLDLFQQACRHQLEGIISKRRDGIYRPGSRREWMKSKCRPRQEFVICGYTKGEGLRSGFGALLLGSFENGRLVPSGKVGTGFTASRREKLLETMGPLGVAKPHFETSDRNVTWVTPQLVAEIEFAEMTSGGSVRQASFVALREDKEARDVHVEIVEETVSGEAEIAGITISHPARLVFPDAGVTKIEVAKYYDSVGELIMPYLTDRPLALLRAPDGLRGQTFFQKSFKDHVPPDVKSRTLEDGTEICYINSLEGLVSLVQYGVIEFHPWGSRMPRTDKPDVVIWDLDPDDAVPWNETLGTAMLLRDFLAERDLETQVKTSGGKGLHVVLHLRRTLGWEVVKSFSKAVAAAVAEMNPGRLTIESRKSKRQGKIYIDWLRNGRGATCIAPWALRARERATVSRPIDWGDLAGLDQRGFTLHEPMRMPDDWKDITLQTVKNAVLEDLGV